MNPEEARLEKALNDAPPEWLVGIYARILQDENLDPRGLADCAWARVVRPCHDMPAMDVACMGCRKPPSFGGGQIGEPDYAPLLTMRIYSLNGDPATLQTFREKMGPTTFYLGRCSKCRKVFWAW